MVEFCNAIFVKFLHNLKENIFHLIIRTYFVKYYSILGSIFLGSFVHINQFPNHNHRRGEIFTVDIVEMSSKILI
jgi:hypothetical protein